jgi:hypothetical protein
MISLFIPFLIPLSFCFLPLFLLFSLLFFFALPRHLSAWHARMHSALKQYRMSHVIRLVAVVAICGGANFTARGQTHILGEWRITEAKNMQGGAYSGTVAIRPLGVSAYLLNWQTNAGAYSGLGLLQDKYLCVGWGTTSLPFGVVAYKLAPDKLVGTWTATGLEGKIGVETATRVRAGIDNDQPIEGEYEVQGENPATKTLYEGVLSIARDANAEIYNLAWDLGATRYNGVGVRRGDYLYVGWGYDEAFGVVLYDVGANGVAQGIWTIPKASVLGVENIKKIEKTEKRENARKNR